MSRNRRSPRPPTPPKARTADAGAAESSGDSLRDAVRAALEAKNGGPDVPEAGGTESPAGSTRRTPPPGRNPSAGPNPGRVGGATGAGRGFRPLPRRTG
jgi:hypothetical protein